MGGLIWFIVGYVIGCGGTLFALALVNTPRSPLEDEMAENLLGGGGQ